MFANKVDALDILKDQLKYLNEEINTYELNDEEGSNTTGPVYSAFLVVCKQREDLIRGLIEIAKGK